MDYFIDLHSISNGNNNYGTFMNAFSFPFSEILTETTMCRAEPQAGEASWMGTGRL